MSELAVLSEAVAIGVVTACLSGVAVTSGVGPFALLFAWTVAGRAAGVVVVAVQEVSRAVECLGAHVMEPRAPARPHSDASSVEECPSLLQLEAYSSDEAGHC